MGDQVVTEEQAVELAFPAALKADFLGELPIAIAAYEELVELTAGADLTSLSRRSPALRYNDWPGYLRCSIARVVHALAAVKRQGTRSGHVLDVGSYFGNFALSFARAGYRVAALDSYRTYSPAFDRVCARLAESRVEVLDFEDVGYALDALPEATFDVVLCMSVIEHVPHTPRPLLEGMNRVIKPGGLLVLETPNLAYLYNRQKLARGASVLAPISDQYYTDGSYEGHHREYTLDELVWLCLQIGHALRSVETFNYSYYGSDRLTGRDAENFWAMVQQPMFREIMMSVSSKPDSESADRAFEVDWREKLVEPETVWQDRIPDAYRGRLQSVEVGLELLASATHVQALMKEVGRLQGEVNLRDQMLQQLQGTANDLQARLHATQIDVNKRDGMLKTQLKRWFG